MNRNVLVAVVYAAVVTGETIICAATLPPTPLLAQGVGALVQPGGIEGLAQQPPRPAAVQAPEGGDAPPADAGEAKPETATAANPFELRFIFSYVLILAFVGGSTFLIIRPSGRKIQGDDAAAKGKETAKAKK
jgi:hypothetical protein